LPPDEVFKRTIQFGAFELKMDTGELRKNGMRVKLQGKAFQILQALLDRPGEVVSREYLKSRLWPSDTFVDFESGLNTAANRLRLTLGDSAENPRFIETVARSGYRFIGAIVEIPAHPVEIQAPTDASAEDTPTPGRLRWTHAAAGVFLAAAAVVLAYWAAHRAPVPSSFRQITFRSGTVTSARFGPDAGTILYSADWDGTGNQMFLANTVSPESRQLEFKPARLASVSPSTELALLFADPAKGNNGITLGRVPLNGGAPLTVANGVAGAEWTPDGKGLAVFRIGSRESVVEFPVGKLYRTAGTISDLRISPQGDAFAFLEHPLRGDDGGLVKLIDRNSAAKDLSTNWASAGGLAWSPSGREVWFAAGQTGIRRTLYSVTLRGKLRQIASVPGTLTLYDISKAGRALVGIDRSRLMIGASVGDDESKESDLSWFDWSHAQDISADGKFLLFDETGDGGGPNHSVYLRNVRADSTVRLGDGQAVALSPDVKWALALNPKKPTNLSLLPIGPETPRMLSGHGLTYNWARYFPDGQRLLVGGSFPGKPLRLFVQPVSGGEPVPLNPDVYLSSAIVSPDGKQIAGFSQNRRTVIVPASGGEPKELPIPFPAAPLQWSKDGKALFVRRLESGATLQVLRVDLATSQYRLWKDLAPSDRVGLSGMLDMVMSQDEHSYAYSYTRVLSELFVVDGWL